MVTLTKIESMIEEMDEDALYNLIKPNLNFLDDPFYQVEKHQIQFMVNEESGNLREMLTDTLTAKQIKWLTENEFYLFGLSENDVPDSAVFFLNEEPDPMTFATVVTGEDFAEDGELDVTSLDEVPENFALHLFDDTYIIGSKKSDF